jgi:hypothetical protein
MKAMCESIRRPTTPEVRTFVSRPSRVRVGAPSQSNSLPSFLCPTTDHGQLATDKSENVDSGISHLISSKVPAVSPFSSNPTSTSHQKVASDLGDLALGNFLVISFPRKLSGLVLPPVLRPNPSKMPVNPPKFTFQHSANVARLGIRLAKLNELENVDSAHPFSSFPCVQGSVGYGLSHQTFQKKPVFALIRGLFPSPLGQNVDLLSFEPRVGTPRKSAIIGKYPPSFSPPNLLRLLRCQPKAEVSVKADTFCPCTNHLRQKNRTLANFFGIRSTSNSQPFNHRISLGTSFDVSSWTLVIRGYASLQKINFSVSAELKQPPLQMNELRRFSTETNEKH